MGDFIDIEGFEVFAITFIAGIIVSAFIMGPMFFQGYRNSKFLDKLKKEQKQHKKYTLTEKDIEP